jgi:hypothetical protein
VPTFHTPYLPLKQLETPLLFLIAYTHNSSFHPISSHLIPSSIHSYLRYNIDHQMSTHSSSSTYIVTLPKHHHHHHHHHHLLTMGLIRSQTSKHITSAPKHVDEEIKLGITRSATDPASEEFRKQNSHNEQNGSGSNSGRSSGTSSPGAPVRRKTNSMDIVRNIRERPSSAIPKYHVLAEQVHRFKMRNCPGMEATAEEQAGIKEMKRWSWKSCGHPGACPLPVGPRNETWYNDPKERNP